MLRPRPSPRGPQQTRVPPQPRPVAPSDKPPNRSPYSPLTGAANTDGACCCDWGGAVRSRTGATLARAGRGVRTGTPGRSGESQGPRGAWHSSRKPAPSPAKAGKQTKGWGRPAPFPGKSSPAAPLCGPARPCTASGPPKRLEHLHLALVLQGPDR